MANVINIDNKSLLAKADTYMADIVLAGGEMKQAPQQKFLAKIMEASKIAKAINVIPLSAPNEVVPIAGFGDFVSRADVEYQESTPATRNALALGKIAFSTHDFKATVYMSYKILRENIEKGQFTNTVIELLRKALAKDIDNVVLNGDTAIAPAHPLFPLLSVMDGMRKKITSNILTTNPFGRAEHITALKMLESKFIDDLTKMRWIQATRTTLSNMDEMQQRATALGDKMIEQGFKNFNFDGIPVLSTGLMPTDLGAGLNETEALLVNTQNAFLGFLQNINIKTQEDIDMGALKIVARYSMDFQFNEEPGNVKAVTVTD